MIFHMGKYKTFEEFLSVNTPDIPVLSFIFNLLIAIFLAYVLKILYVKYGTSLSNRNKFANNFFLLISTTMFIITIVKSSLALSLGLVGALSIVRFRAAIKEPEELAFLFLSIAVGLGLGAGQTLITTIGFSIISMFIYLKKFAATKEENENLLITVRSEGENKVSLETVVNILKEKSQGLKIKRIDNESDLMEASLLVNIDNFEILKDVIASLETLNPNIKITYLDYAGLM